jgi:predicted metal-binding membrane protein
VRTQALLTVATKAPLSTLIAVDLAGWVVLSNSHFSLLMPDFCSSLPGNWMAQGSAGLVTALILSPPAQLIMSCLIMLVAMMTPLLARPITHVWNHSLARLRAPAIALFVAAYAGVWLVAACVLMAIALALKAFSSAAFPIPALAVLIALIWQATPAKQTCLDRCDRLPRLSAFFSTTVWDCVRYGTTTALWCVGACWALMLVPLVVDGMHFTTMAGVTAVLFVERQALATRLRPEMIGNFGRAGANTVLLLLHQLLGQGRRLRQAHPCRSLKAAGDAAGSRRTIRRSALVLSENSISGQWVEDEVQKVFAGKRHRKELLLFPSRIVMKMRPPVPSQKL